MLRGLDDLDCDVVSHLKAQIRRHSDLRYAELSRVLLIRRSSDLERRDHRMRHVRRRQIPWTINTDVDVEEGLAVSWKPSWLYRYRASIYWPLRAILCRWHAAA